MISREDFYGIVELLGQQGQDDIAWTENLGPPIDADHFATQAIAVICNSGMRSVIATEIFERVMAALRKGKSASEVFGHPGKSVAIDDIWHQRRKLLSAYNLATDKVEFCGSLPWIGQVTKYHLAKNFGADCAKPDVHLTRLAQHENTSPDKLCRRLSRATGLRVSTIDTILWRACERGVINSRTGRYPKGRA